MSTPTFYINDVFIAGDEAAKWSEKQWHGIIDKVLPAGKNSVIREVKHDVYGKRQK